MRRSVLFVPRPVTTARGGGSATIGVSGLVCWGCAVITVGTWNLENLFSPGSDAGPDSDAAYEAKLTALAETITTLAPDVLAVQEVGEPDALGDLVDRLGGTWHTALADSDGRGIRVGVLSRLALLVSHALVNAVETVTTGEIDLPSITEQPREQWDKPGSDHRPVMVRFEL